MESGICISWLTAGWVDGRFSESLATSFMYDAIYGGNRIWSKIYAEGGPRITDTRCSIVRQFLVNRDVAHHLTGRMPEWLVMIDSDMSWDADGIHRLVTSAEEHEFDVMGGLCFAGSRTKQVATIYELVEGEDGKAVPRHMEQYPRDAVCQVGATGAAFLAMNRTCLQKMGEAFKDQPYPWFIEGVAKDKQFGEDVAFCMRAQALGFKVGVDTRIKVGHWKRFCYDEGTFGE